MKSFALLVFKANDLKGIGNARNMFRIQILDLWNNWRKIMQTMINVALLQKQFSLGLNIVIYQCIFIVGLLVHD